MKTLESCETEEQVNSTENIFYNTQNASIIIVINKKKKKVSN